MSEKTRSRTFDLLLYDEDETHKAALDKLATGYKYIAIKHDKDTWGEDDKLPDGVQVGDLKKSHWHAIVKFPQARWNTAVASELGIALNYIQKCVSYDGSLLYLIHRGLPDKHQYDPSECIGTLIKDLEKAMDNEADTDEKMQDVIDILDDKEYWTMRRFLEEAISRKRGGMALRMAGLLSVLISEHNNSYVMTELKKRGEELSRTRLDYMRDDIQDMDFVERGQRLERQGYKLPPL